MLLNEETESKELFYMSKDAFLANVSHEMKTPIHAILGMVHFLRSEPLTPKQSATVDKIQRSADLLLALVNDVLDLSRMEEKQVTLQSSPLSMNRLVEYVEDLLLNRIQAKGLSWQVCTNYPGDLIFTADHNRLCQVLTNLIGNAIKYTTKGGITLEITAECAQKGFVELELAVADTGCGIAPEACGRIFEEFDQGCDAPLKYHPGFGLGLAIASRIAEAMGGTLTVESRLGEGSRFALQARFPYIAGKIPGAELFGSGTEAAAAEAFLSLREKTSPEGAPAEPFRDLEPGTCPDFLRKGPVLVVEDTDLSAEIAMDLLQEIGASARRARDGDEAVELLRQAGPDHYSLVLMDIHMPRRNGYEAAELLRREKLVHCPVLAMTATLVDRDVRKKYDTCFSGYLLKPFRAETFYQQIAAAFAARQTDLLAERDRALRDLGGREDLYERYLQRFRNTYCNGADFIRRKVAEGNYEEAFRHAHSIKGLAGTLGLAPLQKAAAEMESELREGRSSPTLLKRFCLVLDQTIQTLMAR